MTWATWLIQLSAGLRESSRLIVNGLGPPRLFLCCKNCPQVSCGIFSSTEVYHGVRFLGQQSLAVTELANSLEVAETILGSKKKNEKFELLFEDWSFTQSKTASWVEAPSPHTCYRNGGTIPGFPHSELPSDLISCNWVSPLGNRLLWDEREMYFIFLNFARYWISPLAKRKLWNSSVGCVTISHNPQGFN